MPALSLLRFIGPYLLALLIGFGAAWQFQSWRYDAKISGMRETAALKLAQATETAKRQTEALQAQVAALDTRKTQELEDAREQTRRLSAAVADGSRRLRIAVARADARVPEPAAGAGVGVDATAELAPEARRAYFDLRAGIVEAQSRLSACQDILRSVVSSAPPEHH